MALAEDPGHRGEPTALHQVSARWHWINAELQMRAKAAGCAHILERTAAALLSAMMWHQPSTKVLTGYSEKGRGQNAENKCARLFRTA